MSNEAVDGVLELESSRPSAAVPVRRGGWREEIQEELDGYYREMKQFSNGHVSPAEIFMKLSGWTARMSEIRGLLYRETGTIATQLRTREVDPFLAECERQYKFHSRRFSGMEFEANLQR